MGRRRGAHREKRKRRTGEERTEGSACNKSSLNALPPTFQNRVKIASSVIGTYNISRVNEAWSKQTFMEHFIFKILFEHQYKN